MTQASVNAIPGPLFEQSVATQLWRRLSYGASGKLGYFRTSDGVDVDFIVETGDDIIPIEVKWIKNLGRDRGRHGMVTIAWSGGRDDVSRERGTHDAKRLVHSSAGAQTACRSCSSL